MGERLRALFCDHLSIMRGKYLPESKIESGETRFCRSTFGVHYDRDLLPSPGSMMMEGLPDMELRWEAGEVREGWEEDTRIVTGDLFASDGKPLEMCGRGALRRAVDVWKGKGLTAKVGVELEAFALIRNEDGSIVPYDAPGSVVYGTGPFSDPRGFNDSIWRAADELGFRVEMMTAEYDSPQYEYTLAFDDAIKAVDDVVLFRLMAREIAHEHGILLSFLPKPLEDRGGSGMHINFSFTDQDGNNAMASKSAGELNELSQGCVAGLLHHHKGLAGLLAPSTNSYKRLQPASLSGYWQNWGGDHRNVTTRVTAETGAKARLEHRMADACANPYTAVASVLQAAWLGVENGYQLPAMESGDGFENTDADQGVAADLSAAIDDLESDIVLAGAIGQGLVDNHVFMKRQEVEKTAGLDVEGEQNFYAHFI